MILKGGEGKRTYKIGFINYKTRNKRKSYIDWTQEILCYWEISV